MFDAQKIKEIIANYAGKDVASINADTTLAALDIDSLDVIEIVMAVEDAMNVHIRESELEEVITVGQFIDAVEKQVRAAA